MNLNIGIVVIHALKIMDESETILGYVVTLP